MDFSYSDQAVDLQGRLASFMRECVLPAEAAADEFLDSNPTHWGPAPVMNQLKAEAKKRGLWNFALPGEPGIGLSNTDYAPLAEMTGWSPFLAPEALNCSPPDTGNMELLSRFGTPEQRSTWLDPLLAGTARSIFSMTEPDVASSDASNVRLAIVDSGDNWVINGTKWWSTSAMRPDVQVALVMGLTDPTAAKGAQHTIVLVPIDSPGVTVRRSTKVLGFDDRYEGGHGVITFDDVRVPKANTLGPRGEGFAVAQTRLGPGRIHHCMRLLGMGERAIALAASRAKNRVAFGVPLAEQGVIQGWMADARTTMNAARLLVQKAAWSMDHVGNKDARHDIAAAKIFVPQAVKEVVDRAIQIHGGAGLSQETILPRLYAQARFLQIADGPDEVHRRSLARAEFAAVPMFEVQA